MKHPQFERLATILESVNDDLLTEIFNRIDRDPALVLSKKQIDLILAAERDLRISNLPQVVQTQALTTTSTNIVKDAAQLLRDTELDQTNKSIALQVASGKGSRKQMEHIERLSHAAKIEHKIAEIYDYEITNIKGTTLNVYETLLNFYQNLRLKDVNENGFYQPNHSVTPRNVNACTNFLAQCLAQNIPEAALSKINQTAVNSVFSLEKQKDFELPIFHLSKKTTEKAVEFTSNLQDIFIGKKLYIPKPNEFMQDIAPCPWTQYRGTYTPFLYLNNQVCQLDYVNGEYEVTSEFFSPNIIAWDYVREIGQADLLPVATVNAFHVFKPENPDEIAYTLFYRINGNHARWAFKDSLGRFRFLIDTSADCTPEIVKTVINAYRCC